MNLDQWGQSVNGRAIDRDGSGLPLAQCWDLWADYADRVLGVPIAWTYTLADTNSPDHFLASSIWLNFPTPRTGDLGEHFTRLDRHAEARPGDVAVWARSQAYPASHIAIATGPAVGGMLPCWTQNPGATKHAHLTTAGLLGYLRPRAFTTPTPTLQGDEEMKNAGFYYTRGGKHINVIANAVSGFYHEFESSEGGYNSGIARGFDTGNFEKITPSQADALKRDCAAVRAGK